MPSRPPPNRRPDGNSHHGNEPSRHSGPAPRSQNSGFEGSTAGHSNQGAANSQASDGQQPYCRDRSDTEDDEPGDPGSRKRKLNQAILGYSMASKKSRSESKFSDVSKLRNRARGLFRFIGPFIHVRSVFNGGYQLAFGLVASSEASSRDPDMDRATMDVYQKMLAFIPGLKEQVEWTHTNHPSGIEALATLLDQSARAGHSDDCASLRKNGVGYIRPVEGVPELDRQTNKEHRGFHHCATARLLCPRHLRDEFDDNPERFCHEVLNGKRIITHNDWPSLLYPEDGYDPDAIDEQLLQSPFLVSCYRHLFTGPRTAMKEGKGKSAGKKCVADIYSMTEVTPVTVTYIAVLGRFMLCEKGSWVVVDGNFNSKAFFMNVLSLFDDEDWAKETLAWWNSWIFGDDHAQDDAQTQGDQSTFSLLAKQHAARKRAPTSELQPAAQESELEAQGPELGVQESGAVGEGSEPAE